MLAVLTAYLVLVGGAVPKEDRASLSPAPGVRFATPSRFGNEPGGVDLDANGSAEIPADKKPQAAGFRVYWVGRKAYYFPSEFRPVSWSLDVPIGADSATLLTRKSSQTWTEAVAFSVAAEHQSRSVQFRFALSAGDWTAALLVPGYAPISTGPLQVSSTARSEMRDVLQVVTSSVELKQAAGLRARPRDSATGEAPDTWSARLESVGPQAAFYKAVLEGRPISQGGKSLAFDSLPSGAWLVEVTSPGLGSARRMLPPATPGGVIDLGDVFLSASGELKAVFFFPRQLPASDLEASLSRISEGQRPQPRKVRVAPKERVEMLFGDLDPDLWLLSITSEASGLYAEFEVPIVSRKTANLNETLMPIRLTGAVYRRDMPLGGVEVDVSQGSGKRRATFSDTNGRYEMFVWAAGEYLFLVRPQRGAMPVPFSVSVPDGVDEFAYDLALPSFSIVGNVQDKVTGQPIAAADIEYSTSSVDDSKAQSQRSAQADASGSFRLENLDPSPINLTVRAEGYAAETISGVVPSDGDGTRESIGLTRSTKIRGRILDSSGSPLESVAVGLDLNTSKDYFLETATTSATGDFAFDAAPGQHFLYAFRCGYLLLAQVVSADSDGNIQTLSLMSGAFPLTLRLVGPGKRPVSNAIPQVELNGVMLPRFSSLVFGGLCGEKLWTGAEGMLTLDFLPPGAVRIFLGEPVSLVGTFVHAQAGEVWDLNVPAGAR
jgi:hypothetical protein